MVDDRRVTEAVNDPARVEIGDGDPSVTRRPIALATAQVLWVAASTPFLLLGVLTTIGSPRQRQDVVAGLPRFATTLLDHRLSGIALWLAAIGFLLAAVLIGPGRRWARTAAVSLTAAFDVALTMMLLADAPRSSLLVAGVVVVFGSLAAVVLGYQPAVERYLG